MFIWILWCMGRTGLEVELIHCIHPDGFCLSSKGNLSSLRCSVVSQVKWAKALVFGAGLRRQPCVHHGLSASAIRLPGPQMQQRHLTCAGPRVIIVFLKLGARLARLLPIWGGGHIMVGSVFFLLIEAIHCEQDYGSPEAPSVWPLQMSSHPLTWSTLLWVQGMDYLIVLFRIGH